MVESLNWLNHDHLKYDEALDECELVAASGDWKNAVRLFKIFVEDLKHHMRIEDEILYPMIEGRVELKQDIALLKDEHSNMVRLLRDLIFVIKTNDIDHFEESLEPLHQYMRDHNEHEEAVFMNAGIEEVLMPKEEFLNRLERLNVPVEHHNWGI